MIIWIEYHVIAAGRLLGTLLAKPNEKFTYGAVREGGEDKSAPSFKKYISERQLEHAIRFSGRGYLRNGRITNLPLYLARKAKELL